jgi:hypothetical protein
MLLNQDPIMRQVAAVAVEQGRVQLQRVTYDRKGASTVEPLTQYRPIAILKTPLKALMAEVKDANDLSKVGAVAESDAALVRAQKAFA